MLREFSAGGVVYRKKDSEILWLATRSTPSELFPKSFWRLPKGWLDDEGDGPGPLARGDKKASDDDLQKAAIREVSEEGGIEATIVKKIGTDKYLMNRGNEKIIKFVTYFLMEYVNDSPNGHDEETAEVAWLPFAEARKTLTHSSSKKILDKARALLV